MPRDVEAREPGRVADVPPRAAVAVVVVSSGIEEDVVEGAVEAEAVHAPHQVA
jgi:hypothetical protein